MIRHNIRVWVTSNTAWAAAGITLVIAIGLGLMWLGWTGHAARISSVWSTWYMAGLGITWGFVQLYAIPGMLRPRPQQPAAAPAAHRAVTVARGTVQGVRRRVEAADTLQWLPAAGSGSAATSSRSPGTRTRGAATGKGRPRHLRAAGRRGRPTQAPAHLRTPAYHTGRATVTATA